MSNPEGIISQDAYELASLELALQQHVNDDASGLVHQSEIDFSVGDVSDSAAFRVVRGQEVSRRFSGDRIVQLTDSGMQTVTDQLALIELIFTESEQSSD